MKDCRIKILLSFLLFPILSWSQIQIGEDIDGEFPSDSSGYSVSLSDDGNILAIGAPSNNPSTGSSGHVRIYKNIQNIWEQVGEDIDGEASSDQSGWSVSLSGDGSTVAIGAVSNDGNGNSSGHVRVYQNIGDFWIQVGSDIDGEASNDQ